MHSGADGRASPEVAQGKRAAIRESSIKAFLKHKLCEATRASCALHAKRLERSHAGTKQGNATASEAARKVTRTRMPIAARSGSHARFASISKPSSSVTIATR